MAERCWIDADQNSGRLSEDLQGESHGPLIEYLGRP
jgi:hypothetical protein